MASSANEDNMKTFPFPKGRSFFFIKSLTFYNTCGSIPVLRVRKEKVKNMTEKEATEFVQNNARYYDDGSFEPYAVMYGGKFIWAESPGDLVSNLLEFVNG